MSDPVKLAVGTVPKQEVIDRTMEIIRIPSYWGIHNQETEAAEYLKAMFDSEGIESWIDPLEEGRSNILAKLPGSGGGRTLMLCGHTDTVPPYDMECATDPYIDREGKLHGRGASDMKGPDIVMAFALIALKRAGIALKGDLIFAGVADEEGHSLGAIDIVEKGYKADAVIIGEPTGKDKISIARKGLEWIDLKFKGLKVHGGMQDKGINAIEMANRFITVIYGELAPKLKERVSDIPMFGHSTVNLGRIEGGDQPSTVAGECLLQIDRRWMPGIETFESMWQEIQDIIDRLHAEDERFQCEMGIHKESKMKEGYVHLPAVQDINSDIVQITKRNAEKAIGHAPEVVGSVGGWDDTGVLKGYGGLDCITYGPGDKLTCHSKNEYIDPDEMIEMLEAYIGTAIEFCGQ